MSPINSVSLNAVLLLPLRHLRCSQSFPPTYQCRHERNRPLTCDIFQNQKEHRCASLLRPFSTFVPPFPATPQFLFLFLSSGPRGFWCGSHRILLLFSPCTISKLFPIRTLLALVRLPLTSSIPHLSKACPPCSARSHHTAKALHILSSLLHNGPTTLHLLLHSTRSMLLLSMLWAS